MTSRNMQTYLRLVGRAGWKQHQRDDYLADDASSDAVFEAYAEDVVVVEPDSLPQGGLHEGRDAWRAMHAGIQDLWDQQFEILDLWDVPADDVIVLHASMAWTGKATGRSATVPFIGVLTFRDALISRVEIFHFDAQAILDTLTPLDDTDPVVGVTDTAQALSAREIRERVGHPLIDGDGHLVEVREAFVRFVHERGDGALLDDPSARALMVPGSELQQIPPLETRQRFHTRTNARWFTTADTRDYAAVTMPALMHDRLADTGFDFSVVFPTYGLHLAHIVGDDARRGLCRRFNELLAEDYAPYRDRLSPVAVLPLHTPDEGIAALEHAHALGLRAFLIPSFVWRTIPAFADAPPEYRARLRRMDTFGLDSEHDYDPFWRRAVELNAPLAAHMSGAGLIDRISPTNYVYSAGQFAATGEALAKSLFLGGVLHRFPGLRVGLMEGGVAVGVRLYGDLVGRWEKRGPEGLPNLDLRNLDTAELAQLARSHAPRLADLPPDRLVPFLGIEDGPTNDFALSGVEGPEGIRDQFCPSFFWGCEGDDPLVAVSFDTRVNPLGATVPAFVGSDIGHWDVPDFEHPLREAYEQIEHGLLTDGQFREFTLTNAVRFYAGDRIDFFAGTAVEGAARAVIDGQEIRGGTS